MQRSSVFCLAASFFISLGSLAFAEVEFAAAEEDFSGFATPIRVTADIGLTSGETAFIGSISGPAGLPSAFTFTWAIDDQLSSPTPINSITIHYGCDSLVHTFNPFSQFYLPGPAIPAQVPTDFGEMHCDQPSPVFEDFNSFGSFPENWTTQSLNVSRSNPWAPFLQLEEDYAMRVSQEQFSLPRSEWLISPTYNLVGYGELSVGFTHDYVHSSSSAQLRYSTNGGVSWNLLAGYSESSSGMQIIDISDWATNANDIRFAFVFEGDFLADESSWLIDDFYIEGVASSPVATNPIPSQPPAAWVNRTGQIGCLWTHPNIVQGSSIEIRIDENGDGDYLDGDSEDWSVVDFFQDSDSIYIQTTHTFVSGNGEYAFEFRARSSESGLWGYSGTSSFPGIDDDWRVLIDEDVIPPTSSVLFAISSTESTVTLAFSPAIEGAFLRYELWCSEDSLISDSDRLWTDVDDPLLSVITTSHTTVTGLSSGTVWYFELRAVDQSGNISPPSNLVRKVTKGSELARISDLTASVVNESIHLTWTPPEFDAYGQSPIAIETYEVHSSGLPFFEPSSDTRIASTLSPEFSLPFSGINTSGYFKVVPVGAGPGFPAIPETQFPSGTFDMGFDEIEEPVHEVELTNAYFLGSFEITNQQFLAALNWALFRGYVEVSGNYVTAYDQDLILINHNNSEIVYDGTRFILTRAANAGEWGFVDALTYDPLLHPVKNITWYGAVCFCDWLSEIYDLPPFYQGVWNQTEDHNPYQSIGFRLPTEAEWEYAAKLGNGNKYPWGDDPPSCSVSNYSQNWPWSCNGWTLPVGSIVGGATELGLFDMSGNVREWTGDKWQPYGYESVVDPLGSQGLSGGRILRSGAWDDDDREVTTAHRFNLHPYNSSISHGFRTCRTILD